MPSALPTTPLSLRSIGIVGLLGIAPWLARPDSARGEDRVVVSIPITAAEPTHRIVSVDPAKRQVRVELAPGTAPGLMPTEGQAVLVVPGSVGGPLATLARVEIDELLEGNVALATFGPGAEGMIRTGPAVLARPLEGLVGDGRPTPAPTKTLRDLPDLVVVAASDAESPTDPKAILRARDAARRAESTDHLKRIADAFHSFADAYGRFPPAAVIGPDGRPWHSWRVLLLPFLEEAGLYQQYDFSQPWDAPRNRQLAERTVKVYRDPAREGPPDGFADYAAIVGRDALFQPNVVKMDGERDFPACLTRGKKVSFDSVTDGTSSTILFATVDPARRIPWTKPEDILLDADFPGFDKSKGIGAIHPAEEGGGRLALVAFADGSVSPLPASVDKADLIKLLTRSGGEAVDRAALVTASDDKAVGPRVVKVLRGGKGNLRLEID